MSSISDKSKKRLSVLSNASVSATAPSVGTGDTSKPTYWKSLAELEQSLPIRTLRNGKGLATNPAYYLATREFAEAHPQVLELFRQELQSAQRWALANVEEAAKSLAPQVGIAREAIGVSLKRSLGESLRQPEIIASQQRIADAFFRLKLIPHPVSVAEAAWPAGA